MVDHLPPGNPAARAIRGPWGNQEQLLWDISAQLRDLVAGYYAVHGDPSTPRLERPYLPTPEPTEYQQAVETTTNAELDAARQDLRRTLNRPGARLEVTDGR
jgi:hypothetical protein